VAEMLAEDSGKSIVQAVKDIYLSDVYKRLEQESTKQWHLGPVALYQEFLTC
jgi:hypothetical protein